MKIKKLAFSIVAFALCFGIGVWGVLAAAQVSLNITSSVTFTATGVFVKVFGEAYKGTAPLTTRVGTYDGYNYEHNDDGTPKGGASEETFEPWSPELEFSETERFIDYKFTITNYSNFKISISVTDESEGDDTISVSKTEIASLNEDETGEYIVSLELTSVWQSADYDLNLQFLFEKFADETPVAVNGMYVSDGVITGLSEDITEVAIPATVNGMEITSIAPNAFKGTSITSLDLSNATNLESIGESAFENCIGLLEITFPEQKITLNSYAFKNTGLTEPASVNAILKDGVFANCSNLLNVGFEVLADADVQVTGEAVFSGCVGLIGIYGDLSITSNDTYVKLLGETPPNPDMPTHEEYIW